jgi:methyl-branched lipid omega-hydroxylase
MSEASSVLLTEPAFWARPHDERLAAYRHLRDSDPVSWQPEPPTEWVPEGGPGYWALTRYSDVVAVTKDFATYSSAQGTNPMDEPDRPVETLGMLHMDPPQHRLFRRIVNPAFMGEFLDGLTAMIEQTADGVIDILAQQCELDLVGPVLHNYTVAVICDILGLPQSERGAFLEATMKAFSPDREAAIVGHNYMIEYIKGLARARRDRPGNDVISRIATSEVDSQRLSDQDVAYFAALLLGAGAETSASTTMQGLWKLNEHPDQLAALRDDFELLAPKAVEEMLRVGSAVVCFRRTATKDAELHGVQILAGQKIVLFYESANHDQTVFETPERFDITRDPNRHVAFGGFGPHLCLGAPLARREITIFFRKLFERFSEIEVLAAPQFAPNQRFNIVKSLPVRLTPR